MENEERFQRADVPSSPFMEFYKHYRREQIMKEFQQIAEHPIQGVYVFPSLKSVQIWHGAVFVENGLYAEGIFHFKIILNDDYPYSKPTVRFTSKVFHPQVTSKGTLNTQCGLSDQGKGKIWTVLKYTRDCFHSLDLNAVCNKDVMNTINKSCDDFKALIRGCVLESLYEFEEQALVSDESETDAETDNPLNAKLLSFKDCQAIREGLLDQFETRNDDGLLGWTRNALGKVWSNLSQYAPDSLNTSRESIEKDSTPKQLSPRHAPQRDPSSRHLSPRLQVPRQLSPEKNSAVKKSKSSMTSSPSHSVKMSPTKSLASAFATMAMNGHSHF